MRGKALLRSRGPFCIRITPAYAGKRRRPEGNAVPRRDHPRVCGEKFRSSYLPEFRMGSPPRMRGKGPCTGARPWADGITPAYAGKRERRSPKPEAGGDHPRVCGEKRAAFVFSSALVGSPPRMRGKVMLCHCLPPWAGITPAYAGKSDAVPLSPALGGDHPRVCGEKRSFLSS